MSSKSINSILKESEKVKKARRKKSKSKFTLAELISSSIQTQLILVSLKNSDINKKKLHILYKKMVKRNIKNIANMKNILEK